MAIRITQLARIIRGIGRNSSELRLEFEWNDEFATIDPDSGEKHADTGELLRFRIINTTPLTGRVIFRLSGKRGDWRNVQVLPGTRLFLPMGPVTKITDLSSAGLSLSRGRRTAGPIRTRR